LAASELVKSQKSRKLVLVATPRFLGVVRAEVRRALPKNVGLTGLGEDLSRQATAQIEKVLARHGVLEAGEPVVAYRRRAATKRTKASAPRVRRRRA
jgi:protein required for attachment to host cells